MTLRRVVQSLMFFIFLFLLFQTAYHDLGEGLSPYFPSDLFLRLDPLSVFSVSLSEWSWTPGAFTLIPLLIMTLILGRVFCGWMCPLGTTLDLFEKLTGCNPSSQRDCVIIGKTTENVILNPDWSGKNLDFSGHEILRCAQDDKQKPIATQSQRKKNRSMAPESGKLISFFTLRSKYYLLVAFGVAALLGVQAIWMADPIPLVTRFYAVIVFPLFEWVVRGAGAMGRGWTGSSGFFRWAEDHLLSMEQPRYAYSLLTGLVFGAILLASLGGRRWWCRKLCPLGALLGLISWIKPLRINADSPCSGCGECISQCKMDAICLDRSTSSIGVSIDNRECILCSTCIDRCPRHSLKYVLGGFKRQALEVVDLPRRRMAGALVGGFFLGTGLQLEFSHVDPRQAVLRPPNIGPEEEFLNRCIRCGECMKVCPTNALHPAFMESGLNGLFSPLMIPRFGYCSYECTLCGQVCPTGAIPYFTPEHKHARSQGLAVFDKNRCIPYREGKDCLVCEEHCPVAPKAITWRIENFLTEQGDSGSVKLPEVCPERCVGCGICENVCPLDGISAIQVHAYSPQKTLSEITPSKGGCVMTGKGNLNVYSETK